MKSCDYIDLQEGVSTPSVRTPGQSGGEVTGSGVDNRIVRWDGTSALQSSALSIDDSGNVSSANASVAFSISSSTTVLTLSAALAAVVGAITASTTITASGAVTGASFVPTGSSVPASGMYLPASNTLGFATNSALVGGVDSSGLWTLGASGGTQTHIINGTGVNIIGGATSNALLDLRVADASAGDPAVIFRVVGIQGWHVGCDNSDSDAFSIGAATTVGTSQFVRISANGTFALGLSSGSTAQNTWHSRSLNITGAATGGQFIQVTNTGNTGATNEYAALFLSVGGGTTVGDPYIHFNISGASDWAIGADNSSSDEFQIRNSTAPGSSASLRIRRIADGGEVIIGDAGTGNFLQINNQADPGAVTDGVRLGSVDLSAGNATLSLRTETAVVTESVTSDRTLPIQINGTTLKICLKA